MRAEALPKLKGGLRALYRTLELPGVPRNYPDAKELVTEDCIRPECTTYSPYEPPNPTPLRKPIPGQSEADAAHFYSAKEDSPPYRVD